MKTLSTLHSGVVNFKSQWGNLRFTDQTQATTSNQKLVSMIFEVF
jgi:hypothetical protein